MRVRDLGGRGANALLLPHLEVSSRCQWVLRVVVVLLQAKGLGGLPACQCLPECLHALLVVRQSPLDHNPPGVPDPQSYMSMAGPGSDAWTQAAVRGSIQFKLKIEN